MDEGSKLNIVKKARIVFEEKNMKAFLLLEETGDENNQLTRETIIELIERAGIEHGIKNELIGQIVEEKIREGKFLIAQGTPPIAGEDAKFDFNFNTDKSLKPKILEDGHIDYKDVSLVNSVNKDSILVKKIAAKPGVTGTDVLGKVIPAAKGRDFDIIAGQGTYKDPEDSSVIKSSLEGIIFYNEKKRSIEVQKLYLVPKSVDYSTGNIKVKSSVDIKGDIKPHFSVSTPYNVQVKGIVENATITCDGALSVAGGIIGDNKQWIQTGGDIHTAYINNQLIRCRGSVYVTSEIRNSIIECDDEVVMARENGVIIGGKITATNKVNAASIGNVYYVPTEIEVGVKLEFKEKFLEKEVEKKAMQKQIEEIQNQISESENGLFDMVKTAYIESLILRGKECSERLERLRKKLTEIETEYYNVLNPVIRVSKIIFPGVILKIKNAIFEVKDEMSHVKFTFEEGEIKVANL